MQSENHCKRVHEKRDGVNYVKCKRPNQEATVLCSAHYFGWMIPGMYSVLHLFQPLFHPLPTLPANRTVICKHHTPQRLLPDFISQPVPHHYEQEVAQSRSLM